MVVLNILEEGRFGGPQKRIVQVAKGCEKHGIKTIPVFPTQNSSKYQKYLEEYEIDYETLPLHRITKDMRHLLKYVFFFPFEIFSLYKLIKRLKPSVVHCNGSYQIKGVIASKLARVPSIWHMNDSKTRYLIKKSFRYIKWMFGYQYVAASLKSAEYYFPDKSNEIYLLPSPIDTSEFDPIKVVPSDEILTRFKGIRVVTVGNVNWVKGHETLLRAAHIVNQEIDCIIDFIVVGELFENQSEIINNLRSLKNELGVDNFHLWGSSSRVKEILQSADLYVCSSNFEGSPISVWEALSMGKPTISTDVSDIKTVFEKNDCGITVDIKNHQQLAKEILLLIADKNRQEELSTNARSTAVNMFDINICCKRHAHIYQSVRNNFEGNRIS